MALSTTLTLILRNTLTKTANFGTPTDSINVDVTDSLASGVAIDQADMIWADTRTLAGTTAENLDLYGTLINSLGTTFSPVKIKGLYIRNKSTTAGNILVIGGHLTAAWEGWTTVAGSKFSVPPNGLEFKWNPSLAGWAITPTTADLLKVENVGATSVAYDIIVIGTSA